MAPPPQFLILLLFFHLFLLSPLLPSSSLSVSAYSHSAQAQLTQISLGRRTLLAKTAQVVVADDDDVEQPPLPKKKKATKKLEEDEDEDEGVDDESVALAKKKKKKTTNNKDSQDDEQVLPKKKKLSSSSSSSAKELDDDGEVLPKRKNSEEDEDEAKKKKLDKDAKLVKSKTSSSSKNQTKLLKTSSSSSSSSSSSKNQTKLIKPIGGLASSKNKTKLIKTTASKDVDDSSSSSSKPSSPNLAKIKLKKLNSTSSKASTSTKSSSTTKSSDPAKSKTDSNTKSPKPSSQSKDTDTATATAAKKKAPPSPASWMYGESGDDDLVMEFRDLPAKFQQTFIPDLHRISTTSKIYLTKANKEMTKGFKPYVGNKYAPSVATAMCVAFIVVPLLLVSLIFNKIKAYFSLQRLLIFVQIYLAIYFSILCLSSLLTGLEPLRFFYATSQSTYVWLQVLQTLGYVLYLLLLLMYLVLVFSTETTMAQKFLGLAQTIVGFAVGLHYYMTVFHRVVLRQPPKTNWKVHGIYATCFVVICLFARAERRKKAYLVEGGEEGKKS